MTVGIGASFVISFAAQSALGWRAALLMTPILTALLALAMGRVWIPERESTGVPTGPAAKARFSGGSTSRRRCCSAVSPWSSASTCGRRNWSPTGPGCRRRWRRSG
ncbi:hypothetical protein ACFQX6_46430 [Streptosporangium lutulentum]